MNGKDKKRFLIRLAVSVLVVAMTYAMLPFSSHTSYAASDTDKTVSGLGVSSLNNPRKGNGGWCKVYYGSSRTPLRFKVLNTHETVFGGDTLLIDCDSIISRDYAALWWDYHWNQSQLSGATYFDTKARLTNGEIGAVHASTKTELAEGDVFPVYDPQGILDYEFEEVKNDKFFILDAAEAMNGNYGFPSNRNKTDLRKKTDNGNDYWLRSKSGHWSQADSVAYVKSDGSMTKKWAGNYSDRRIPERESGISPAMNINLDQILFTTLISGRVGQAGAEYKLTVLDNTPFPYYIGDVGIETKVQQVTRHGNDITVPFTVNGLRAGDVNRISYLVTDKAWNAEGARILEYGELDITSGNITSNGVGTFVVPEAYDEENPDHCVYIFAENVRGGTLTDFASQPVKIDVPIANIKAEATPYEGVYDGQAHSISMNVQPAYATVRYGTEEGTYTLDEPPAYTDAGEYTVYYQVTAEDYETVEGSSTITIAKRPVTVRGIEVSDKAYDGTTEADVDASRVAIDNVVDNEYLDVEAAGVFHDPDAEENKPVNLTYTLAGRDGTNVDNYVLDPKGSDMETIATITKRTVTVHGIKAYDKLYDDSWMATLNYDEVVIDNMVEGDDLYVDPDLTRANFNNPSLISQSQPVLISYLALAGSDLRNYILDRENSQDRTTATIWPSGEMFVEVSEKTHVYDGQYHSIKITVSDTVQDPDPNKVTIRYRASEDDDWTTEPVSLKDVGTTTVYYWVEDRNVVGHENSVQGSATLRITKKPVKVSAEEVVTKVYDGTRDLPSDFDTDSLAIDGKVENDDIHLTVGNALFSDENAGEGKTVLLSGLALEGSAAGNYMLEPSAQLTGTITKRPITVRGIRASDKEYDGTTDATVHTTNMMVQNVIKGDKVTVKPTGSFVDPNAGDRTIDLSYALSGDDAGNYYVDLENSQTTTAATIHKKDLAFGGGNTESEYDGNAYDAEVYVDTDVEVEILYGESSDSCTLKECPKYSDVGLHMIYYTITSKDENYNSTGGTVFVKIHPRRLVVTGITAEDKDYDGKKDATLNTYGMEIQNVLEGEDVTVTPSGAFASAKPGQDKRVNITYEIGGKHAHNYVIDENKSQTRTTADINAPTYTITYDLNGGELNGETGTVEEQYLMDTVITMPEPTRKGYTFLYWKGSRYEAGDKYTVTEDHTFTAKWKKNGGADTGDKTDLIAWLALMAASAGTLGALRLRHRKSETH